MLRLFRQHGVCAANYRIAQQRIQFKRFFNGPEGESGVTQGLFESVDKQEGESSGKARLQVKQNWTPNDNDRLWDHVNKLADRVAGLNKDLGDFKGDVHKSIGELAQRMERGFGDMNTKFAELALKIDTVKSDFKFTKWQVHLIFGGVSGVLLWLVKDYAERYFSVNQREDDLVRRVVSEPGGVGKPV